MKKPVWFISIFLLLAACRGQERPLSEMKMEAVLFDIQLAEAYSMNLPHTAATPANYKDTDSLNRFYQEIFKQHKITYADYKRSMAWYAAHPERLDTVFAHVGKRLSDTAKRYHVAD